MDLVVAVLGCSTAAVADSGVRGSWMKAPLAAAEAGIQGGHGEDGKAIQLLLSAHSSNRFVTSVGSHVPH